MEWFSISQVRIEVARAGLSLIMSKKVAMQAKHMGTHSKRLTAPKWGSSKNGAGGVIYFLFVSYMNIVKIVGIIVFIKRYNPSVRRKTGKVPVGEFFLKVKQKW